MNAATTTIASIVINMYFVNGYDQENREVAATVVIDNATQKVLDVLSQNYHTVDNFDGTVTTIDADFFNQHGQHEIAEALGVEVLLPF